MPMTLNTSELPLIKFKFVLKTIEESKTFHVVGSRFETAVALAREEAKKHAHTALAYGGAEAME